MLKKIKVVISIMCLCFILTGCDMQKTHRNIYLLSADELISYYEFTEEEIGEYDVQEFINAYLYTDDILTGYRRGYVLQKIRDYFDEQDVEYAILTPGERKDYMGYDNIKYVIYSYESKEYHDDYAYIYDFVNDTYRYEEAGHVIFSCNISEAKERTICDLFEKVKLLEYPSQIIYDREDIYLFKVALVYENREHVCFSWFSDFHREEFGEYRMLEIEEVLIDYEL